jgi:hypothetical protein
VAFKPIAMQIDYAWQQQIARKINLARSAFGN